MACLVLVYEQILKAVKVHKGDKLLQPQLIARNTGGVIKGRRTLCAHCAAGSKSQRSHSSVWAGSERETGGFGVKLIKKEEEELVGTMCEHSTEGFPLLQSER